VSRPSTPTLELVQVFRGAAAILVMLYHVGMVNQFYFPFAGDVFKWGYSGIDFFFILSGFIMLFVHQDRAGDAGYTWRFLMLRAVRIFPIYWCVLALTVVLVWMCPPLPANQWAPASTLTLPTLTRACGLSRSTFLSFTLSRRMICGGVEASRSGQMLRRHSRFSGGTTSPSCQPTWDSTICGCRRRGPVR